MGLFDSPVRVRPRFFIATSFQFNTENSAPIKVEQNNGRQFAVEVSVTKRYGGPYGPKRRGYLCFFIVYQLVIVFRNAGSLFCA
jgi:hypothetical protein